MKFSAIDRGERRFKWHGTAGAFVQYLTTATLALGVLHVMGRSLDVAFSWCILFAVGCVFVSWVCLMRENPIWCLPPCTAAPPAACRACPLTMRVSGSTASAYPALEFETPLYNKNGWKRTRRTTRAMARRAATTPP